MRIDVLTIFPAYLDPVRESLLGKAIADGVVQLRVHDLRDWTTDRHRSVDDSPYGGGPGMVMRADVWGAALDAVCTPETTLLVPTPAGRLFDQRTAVELSSAPHLVVACGRYEGIDQRVLDDAATRMPVREVSIGDYVLAGGEAAALVVIEAVTRLIPGVLGNPDSAGEDSFSGDLRDRVEAPSYTRPARYRGRAVPELLTGGDHAAVARYRRDESLLRTAANRPELVARWSDADRARLAELRRPD